MEKNQEECIGLPWWINDEESACQGRRCGFDPWSGKIPLFNIAKDQMAFNIPTQKVSTGVNISFMPHSVRQESQRAKMLNFIDQFKVELQQLPQSLKKKMVISESHKDRKLLTTKLKTIKINMVKWHPILHLHPSIFKKTCPQSKVMVISFFMFCMHK